jgi:hypothetical protein
MTSTAAPAARPKNADFAEFPGYGQKRRFYTPEEVAMHNCLDDCWVAALGKARALAITQLLSEHSLIHADQSPAGTVYDLSDLISQNQGPLAKPLVQLAGQDISYLFDPKTGDPRTWIEPVTNLKQYYTPCGRFLHVPPTFPHSLWKTNFGLPWWKNPEHIIGQVRKTPSKVHCHGSDEDHTSALEEDASDRGGEHPDEEGGRAERVLGGHHRGDPRPLHREQRTRGELHVEEARPK